jgi:hypothetical protein
MEGATMRDYYYLNQLEGSPYKLSVSDALHMGSICSLEVYTFITDKIILQCRKTHEQISDSNVYLKVPFPLVGAIEKEFVKSQSALHGNLTPGHVLNRQHRLAEAIITDKYNGTIPFGIPFEQQSNGDLFAYIAYPAERPFQFGEFGADFTVCLSDLICWTDDLACLEKRGCIQRHDNNKANKQFSDNERQDYSPQLETLILAWRKNWKDADRNDRSGCPKKDDVKAWLVEQGFSAKNADAGATIIKPQWATDKGW